MGGCVPEGGPLMRRRSAMGDARMETENSIWFGWVCWILLVSGREQMLVSRCDC